MREDFQAIKASVTFIGGHKKFPSLIHHQSSPWETVKPNELIRIFGSGTQIIRCQWQQDPIVKTIFRQVETNDLVRSGFCTIIRVDERLKLSTLPSFAGRRAMVEDISLVSEICSEFLRCKEIALRLEVLGSAIYPHFRIDHSAKDPSRVWKYSAVPCVRIVI